MAGLRVPPLAPSIGAQVAALCSFPKVDFQVSDVRCGWDEAEFADRFTVHVPCGWDRLEWHVLFSSHRPLDPPDVIFHSSPHAPTFQHMLMREDAASCHDNTSVCGLLKDWQPHDPHRLLRLLIKLRSLFLSPHRQLVHALTDERIRFEMGTMAGQEFEVFAPVPAGKTLPEEVHLTVAIPGVSLRPMLQFSFWADEIRRGGGEMPIKLMIKFGIAAGQQQQQQHGSHSTTSPAPAPPQLKLSCPPPLLSLLEFPDTTLPSWGDGMCTVAYVPELAAFLHAKLEEAVTAMQARAAFISALPAVFGQLVETDTQLFSHTTVFVTAHNCMLLVRMAVPPSFPNKQPALTLQSVHHFDSFNLPVSSQPITGFPWSPRWTPREMAQRLSAYLAEECVGFKRFCVEVSRGAAPLRQ